MKTFLSAVYCMFAYLVTFGQTTDATIIGHFKADPPDSVTVRLPVNQNPSWALPMKIPVAQDGTFKIVLQDSSLGYVTVNSGYRTFKMFLQKDDILNIEIDSQTGTHVLFTGSSAAGQALLSDDSLASLHFYLEDEFQMDTTWQSFISHILKVKKKKNKPVPKFI